MMAKNQAIQNPATKSSFVEALIHLSLRIAKAEMPKPIAEELILPCVKDINCILNGKETKSKLNILFIHLAYELMLSLKIVR